MNIEQVDDLHTAFDEFDSWSATTKLEEENQPSVMMLTFQPMKSPNSRARITGDPHALVQVLMVALGDPSNEEFQDALYAALGIDGRDE
jgi:hypothetical protein